MRYVILQHTIAGVVHFDWLVDLGSGALVTWHLDSAPDGREPRPVRAGHRHRRIYLSYQGPVYPAKGWVRRWDQGRLRICQYRDPELRGLVAGTRLYGEVHFRVAGSVESLQYVYQPRWHGETI